ncbi:hypothetical protein BKA70DRAFT_1416028 [Coprinopsis sp. MPI-PUGE-AT-0042]|nr:hypothetical protein BKA70DRAFT_1416028 [Coprinopsis sp. MPI-PUGE-AT-0042]
MVDTREKYSGPAHLLHVAPDSTTLFGAKNQPGGHRLRDTLAKPRLVAGIEQFVLAFAYPSAASLKPSASAAASISSGKGKESMLPSPLHSTSAIPSTQSSNGMLLEAEPGLIAPPRSLIEQLNGKPAPYIVKAGVLGGVFSFSTTGAGQDSVAQTVSIGDLLLFGALDGSIEEQGGGKAWLGGVGAREVAESLCGNVQGGVEVRHTPGRIAIENVWIGGLADDPRPRRREKPSKQSQDTAPSKRPSVSRTPSASSSGATSTSSGHSPDKSGHSHRSPSKVPRKPAPTITASDSMTAAWNALQSKVKPKASSTPPSESEEAPQAEKTRRKREHKEGSRNRKSAAWNPDTGLLTPPGSSSEKDVELDSELSHRDIDGSPRPPVDDLQSQVSASPPVGQAEESFDFVSCYQYDQSQCPQALQLTERKLSLKDRERKASETLPSHAASTPDRRRTLSSAPPSSRKPPTESEVDGLERKPSYHYTKARTIGPGRTASAVCEDSTTSPADNPVKRKTSTAGLGKLLGRVFSIRGSPDSQNPRRRRRLSVVSPAL